jgi:hypothetical protein
MKIKYIIDSPYMGKFTLTDARDGDHNEISEKTARSLIDGPSSHETFVSAKADVALRSVDQKEIFPGTLSALALL